MSPSLVIDFYRRLAGLGLSGPGSTGYLHQACKMQAARQSTRAVLDAPQDSLVHGWKNGSCRYKQFLNRIKI